jgi:hypothetical protein
MEKYLRSDLVKISILNEGKLKSSREVFRKPKNKIYDKKTVRIVEQDLTMSLNFSQNMIHNMKLD